MGKKRIDPRWTVAEKEEMESIRRIMNPWWLESEKRIHGHLHRSVGNRITKGFRLLHGLESEI